MIWLGLIIILGGIYFAIIYNKFIGLANRVTNAWAQINVQLKKRSDLIPQLVNIVKGYSKYEKKTLTEITKLRTAITSTKSIPKKYTLNKEIGNMFTKFFIIAENYPSLKANENFKLLQEEISEIEDKIAFTRQFYNDVVFKYNTLLLSFPSSIVGKIMKLKQKHSFDEKTNYKGVEF